jgi:two-component system, NarL family, sensor kinase
VVFHITSVELVAFKITCAIGFLVPLLILSFRSRERSNMAVSIKPSRKTVRGEEPSELHLTQAEPRPLEPGPLWIYATIVPLLTASAIVLFEIVKQMLFPSLTAWRAHTIVIVAGSLVATCSGYFVLRWQRAVEKRAGQEALARYQVEKSLTDVRQQLAQKFCEEREIRGAHQLLQAAIDALSAHIAILDETGTLLAVNQAWRRFADENGLVGRNYGIGAKYLEFGNRSSDHEANAAAGIGEVLRGQTDGFRLLYPCSCVDGQRWFQLRVSQFVESGGKRLLVSHEDVTDVKVAQEAQRDIDNRILQSRDQERRKIARELHDSTVQKIFAVNLNLMGLKTLGGDEKKVQDLLTETISLGRECMQELRTISYLLRPPLPAGHDFLPALYSYVDGFRKRSGIRVNLVLPSHAGRMAPKIENALFRVVQETLSNIHRHSQSATATVALRKNEESVVLEVRDKGKGIPHGSGDGPYWATGGGLGGIEERVHELGGSLEIKPANPGTVVTATIPLAAADAQRSATA